MSYCVNCGCNSCNALRMINSGSNDTRSLDEARNQMCSSFENVITPEALKLAMHEPCEGIH